MCAEILQNIEGRGAYFWAKIDHHYRIKVHKKVLLFDKVPAIMLFLVIVSCTFFCII